MTFPDVRLDFLFRGARLRVLIVTDDIGSFGYLAPGSTNASTRKFSLSELVRALTASPYWVRTEITKAHRGVDTFDYATLSTADRDLLEPEFKSGFRFTQAGFNLSDYDVVLLISIDASTTTAMTNAELLALTTFMNSGGGVFATGDHSNLGSPLCGRIPRVRTMRNWSSPSPVGPTRNDSTRPGHDAQYTFDDQSDDIPQPIQPRWYGSSFSSTFLNYSNRYPHPLLCGSRGVITVLPDHMHEGECVDPADLDAQITDIPGISGREWPLVNGSALAPEVIASSTNIPGHTLLHYPVFSNDPAHPSYYDDQSLTQPKTYGAIGAYDGQRAGVGRVVVDSTFHHFIDLNVTGDPLGTSADKRAGFTSTAAGLDAFRDIQDYWRNIAIWLAPPAVQAEMFWRATWLVRWTWPAVEYLKTPELLFGGPALDALGRVASRCQAVHWIVGALLEEVPRFIDPGDPWRPRPLRDDRQRYVNPAAVYEFAYRGALTALAEAYPTPTAEHQELEWQEIAKAGTRGARRGLEQLVEETRVAAEALYAEVEILTRG